MRKIILIFLTLAFCLINACEKNSNETGKVLFCTNSMIINCPFEIEIKIDNKTIGTLDAATINKDQTCQCDTTRHEDIGLLIKLDPGEYDYYAEDINCGPAENATSIWSGKIIVLENDCIEVFLDVFP